VESIYPPEVGVFFPAFSRYILSVSVLVAEEKDGSAHVGVEK
jgi:hypothetical protein